MLTNALRHAPGARVSVSVRYGRDLVLELLDDARRATPDVVLMDTRMPALDELEASAGCSRAPSRPRSSC